MENKLLLENAAQPGSGPNPVLCNLQLAVLHMSGAAGLIIQIMEDSDDSDFPRASIPSPAFWDVLTAQLLTSGRALIYRQSYDQSECTLRCSRLNFKHCICASGSGSCELDRIICKNNNIRKLLGLATTRTCAYALYGKIQGGDFYVIRMREAQQPCDCRIEGYGRQGIINTVEGTDTCGGMLGLVSRRLIGIGSPHHLANLDLPGRGNQSRPLSSLMLPSDISALSLHDFASDAVPMQSRCHVC